MLSSGCARVRPAAHHPPVSAGHAQRRDPAKWARSERSPRPRPALLASSAYSCPHLGAAQLSLPPRRRWRGPGRRSPSTPSPPPGCPRGGAAHRPFTDQRRRLGAPPPSSATSAGGAASPASAGSRRAVDNLAHGAVEPQSLIISAPAACTATAGAEVDLLQPHSAAGVEADKPPCTRPLRLASAASPPCPRPRGRAPRCRPSSHPGGHGAHGRTPAKVTSAPGASAPSVLKGLPAGRRPHRAEASMKRAPQRHREHRGAGRAAPAGNPRAAPPPTTRKSARHQISVRRFRQTAASPANPLEDGAAPDQRARQIRHSARVKMCMYYIVGRSRLFAVPGAIF